ncbi:glutathione S-transferase N-terminal domain-containing protein [Quisquiliibacterium transsilvanicum]|uniref:GST-like protein n=1 Tax=Quisquiliibacterium transsilvanicum TaxID=1549638 RepID=A0A7W8M745_9BURK|nr:glutathione S-transferase N-terminal domain-containing protein [Quisquiliibacterium transsilvanicum]MBB5270536.1 GST-like protein [Quisquiliibacterium transsilvanicum]
MIDLYTWPTPNGHKVHIMLEECRLPYAVHPVDIGAGGQFAPDFLAISPNNKIPALVDGDGPGGAPIALFESGAILLYLAGKTGRFLPRSDRGRFEVLQWLMWQVGGFGPMLGQAHHFRLYAPERVQYAYDRYTSEARRLYGVLERQLEKTGAFVAGRQYTIADMAIWPWARSHASQGIDLAEHPGVQRWHDAIAARPAVRRAVEVLAERRRAAIDDQARNALFGAAQYAKR